MAATQERRIGAPPGYRPCSHCLAYVLTTELWVYEGKRWSLCSECGKRHHGVR